MDGIVDGRILQAVAQGFVIDEDLRARRDGDVAGQIPIVDQIVFGHGGATSLSCN